MQIVIIGMGAAGLMAAIIAGRHATPGTAITVLDGAAKPGAKILVAGGGRCNVTHDSVTADAYAGGSRNAIKKVLRRFDVPQTTAFFDELGVALKRESTGKLFPVTDSARTVLDALMAAASAAGVALNYPCRVDSITRNDAGFIVSGEWGHLPADRVILATGGRSLPKTGSDGGGYLLARALGHTVTDYIFPALVPLTLPAGHPLCALSGITLPTTITVSESTGKRIARYTDSTLLTHFGLSGPGPLDISRYVIDARRADPHTLITINFVPDLDTDGLDQALIGVGSQGVGRFMARWLPDRLIKTVCEYARIAPDQPGATLPREKRRALSAAFTAYPLPITGDRGFNYAEVTAGGVPLTEITLETMESRRCDGLYLCGELCDVDGRIGGYNFQWAWASGYVAGLSAARLA